MKKIVIEPCFNEAHFMPYHIDNICEYLQPDVYVISEGAFPLGPEGTVSSDELSEFTLNGYGKRSFDFLELNDIVEIYAKKYERTLFILEPMDYGACSTQEAYFKAYNNFLSRCVMHPEDIIFSIECDIFLNQDQASKILALCTTLQPGEGFGSTYKRFFESPFIEMSQPTKRKVAFKYGDGSYYKNTIDKNFDDTYLSYLPIYDLKLHHYEWIRPGKYFDLRLAQLKRNQELYKQLQEARNFIQATPRSSTKDLSQFSQLDLIESSAPITEFSPHILQHEKFKNYELYKQ